LSKFDSETFLNMCREFDRAHRLARLGAADADDVSAGGRSPKIVVEADDAVNLGAREIQRSRDFGDRIRRDIAKALLDGVQQRHQRVGPVINARDDLVDNFRDRD